MKQNMTKSGKNLKYKDQVEFDERIEDLKTNINLIGHWN